MTTATSNSKLPEPDTKSDTTDDAASSEIKRIVQATIQQMKETPAPNWGLIIASAAGVIAVVAFLMDKWGQSATYYAEFSNLKQETTRLNVRMDKTDGYIADVATLKVEMSNVKDSVKRIEDAQTKNGDKLDRILETRK
jgi:hypothetical protein